MPMQRTAQAGFYVDGVLPVAVFQIPAIALAKSIVIGGVYCVGSRLKASVTRAAADWRR